MKPPRDLVVGDLHLTNLEDDKYRHEFQKELRKIAEKEHVDRTIILGDLTEAKDRHPAALVNAVVDHLYKLSSICDVIVIQGNHDYADIASPFFEFVKRISNIQWIGRPLASEDILYLPHSRQYERDWDRLPAAFTSYRWVYTHNTFEGADMGHGQKSGGIPLSVFPSGTKVISGDVHVPQKLGCVTYVGTPYPVYYGDDFNPRVLIVEGKSFRSIPVDSLRKHSAVISSIDDLKRATGVSSGDMMKVQIDLPRADYDRYAKLRDEVYAWAEKNGVHIAGVRNKTKIRTEAHKTFSLQDDKELIRAYVKRKGANERVLKTGLRIMEKT